MNETPEIAHTPLPWSVQDEDFIWCGEGDSPNAPLFRPDSAYRRWGREINRAEREANAAFIVRACNSHYQLVGALQWIADNYENVNLNHVDFRVEAKRRADNALSQAGGE